LTVTGGHTIAAFAFTSGVESLDRQSEAEALDEPERIPDHVIFWPGCARRPWDHAPRPDGVDGPTDAERSEAPPTPSFSPLAPWASTTDSPKNFTSAIIL
jgi:hypothetical protein